MRDYRTHLIKEATKWGRRAIEILQRKGLRGRDILPRPPRIKREKDIFKRFSEDLRSSTTRPDEFRGLIANLPDFTGFLERPFGRRTSALPTGILRVPAFGGQIRKLKPSRAEFEDLVKKRLSGTSLPINELLEELKIQAGRTSPTKLDLSKFFEEEQSIDDLVKNLREAKGLQRLKSIYAQRAMAGFSDPVPKDTLPLLTLQAFFPDAFNRLREKVSLSPAKMKPKALYKLDPVANQVRRLIKKNPEGLLRYLEHKNKLIPSDRIYQNVDLPKLPSWLHASQEGSFPLLNPLEFSKKPEKSFLGVSKKYRKLLPQYNPEEYAWRGFNLNNEPLEKAFVTAHPAIAGGYTTISASPRGLNTNLANVPVLGRIPLKQYKEKYSPEKLFWTPHFARAEEEARSKLLRSGAKKAIKNKPVRQAGISSWSELGDYEMVLPEFRPEQADQLFIPSATPKSPIDPPLGTRALPLKIREGGNLVPATVENILKHPGNTMSAAFQNKSKGWKW